jgi:hypothetical protein
MRAPIPLSKRPLDIALLVFFAINLTFTTYVVSLEQIVIVDPLHYLPPIWPPEALLKLVHWWEQSFDPLLLARPAWYRATIWMDCLVFGPFYLAAIYAFAKGRDWIRIPCVIWGSLMVANVFIICFDELLGEHATPHPGTVIGANASWFLMPFLVGWRVLRTEHPFTEPAETAGPSA